MVSRGQSESSSEPFLVRCRMEQVAVAVDRSPAVRGRGVLRCLLCTKVT